MKGSLPELCPDTVEDAPDLIVSMFADPLDFLRELLQNSIDAGSKEIEVSCTFEEEDSNLRCGLGTAIIRMTDFGEGMDYAIITTRLTQLFSSEKLCDRTKIGKFGVGFISVFAWAPDAVCVDTGRYGESFRVLFRPDRTFTCINLSEAVEGTTVRLFKVMTYAEFESFEPQFRKALLKFGQHLEASLFYKNEELSTPIDLNTPIKVMVRDQGAVIVVGYTPNGEADTAGFYNRGLLLHSRPSGLPGISYKINSPRLLCTLGRDAVVQDGHYHELLQLVKELASSALIEVLSKQLDQGLRRERPQQELACLQHHLGELLRREEILPEACAHRLVACSPHGDLFTLSVCEVAARAGRLFCVRQPSPLSAAASAHGDVVLAEWQAPLLKALCRGEPPRLESVLVLPLPLPLQEMSQALRSQAAALCAATLALLGDPKPDSLFLPYSPTTSSPSLGSSFLSSTSLDVPRPRPEFADLPIVEDVMLGSLDYPGSGAGKRPFVMQAQPFTITRIADAFPQSNSGKKKRDRPRGAWVINADHPSIKALLLLAETEPELAAYNVIKLCLLGGKLTLELDSYLLTMAMEQRCHRQETDR